MKELTIVSAKLAQIIKEMNSPKFYYLQPHNETNMTHIASSQQKQWISRLSMIQNELEGM